MRFLVTTLSNAAIYGLVAVSLNIVYRSSGILNFGAGHIAAFSGILYANEFSGSVLGLGGAVLVGALVSLTAYFVAVRGGELLGVSEVSLSLALLGVGLVLNFAAGEFWQKTAFAADPIWSGSLNVGSTSFAAERLLIVVGATVAVLVLIAFIERTMIGHAMEATASDSELAELYGVRTNLVGIATWLVAGAVLGLAGAFQASLAAISRESALTLVILGIVAAVIGGLGSFSRAIGGAVVTAAVQTAFIQYVSPRYSVSLVFILLFFVLVLRPEGLFANLRTAQRV